MDKDELKDKNTDGREIERDDKGRQRGWENEKGIVRNYMKNFTLIPVCILLIPRCIRANQRERAIKVCVSPVELSLVCGFGIWNPKNPWGLALKLFFRLVSPFLWSVDVYAGILYLLFIQCSPFSLLWKVTGSYCWKRLGWDHDTSQARLQPVSSKWAPWLNILTNVYNITV